MRFIEEFVQAVFKLWPDCMLHWEDFWKNNAIDILERYRYKRLSFNDDIQGTAAIGVSGVLAGFKLLGTDLKDARVVMLGGGAAGTGIMSLIENALNEAGHPNAKDALAVLDSRGLISTSRPNGFGSDTFKAKFAKTPEEVASLFGQELTDQYIPLETVIEKFKPNVLIGTSGVANTFTEEAIRTMAKHCDRPIIMPFSNPTSCAEAIPQDIIEWTNDKAVIASGSPFRPVTLSDGTTQQRVGQGNNVFVFPGIGLGAIFGACRIITDNMLLAAARAVAEAVDEDDMKHYSLYPKVCKLRAVTVRVAAAVYRQGVRDGVVMNKIEDCEVESRLEKYMWQPVYKEYF